MHIPGYDAWKLQAPPDDPRCACGARLEDVQPGEEVYHEGCEQREREEREWADEVRRERDEERNMEEER